MRHDRDGLSGGDDAGVTRYETRLTVRRPPWFVRAARRLVRPYGRWVEASSGPWWFHWFAVLVPYRLRGAHRWYAGRRGVFWLPCPLCGVGFGGHEWRSVGGRADTVPDPLNPPTRPDGPGMLVGICPRCTRQGRGVDV